MLDGVGDRRRERVLAVAPLPAHARDDRVEHFSWIATLGGAHSPIIADAGDASRRHAVRVDASAAATHARIRGPRPFQMQRLGELRRSRRSARRAGRCRTAPLSSRAWESRTAGGAPRRRRRRAHEPGPRRAPRDEGQWSDDDAHPNEPFSTRELAEALLDLAASPRRHVDDDVVAEATEHLCTINPAVVRREAERQALRLTGEMWNGGWQPAELVRQVQRATNATTARLALVVIAADHARRRAATLDPRWIEQLDRLGLPAIDQPAGWLSGWAASEHADWHVVVGAVVAYLRCLASLTRLPILIPPPGTRPSGAPIDLTSRTNDPILERVRALLAQAESTTFEAEAEAFTAKAQELMTRHAIDSALVSAQADRGEAPITVRVPIDDPYVDAKSLLLHCVAENSRCRSVFHGHFALATLVGFASDVAATEVLFTSLLVQAQTAMQAAAATAPAGRAHAQPFVPDPRSSWRTRTASASGSPRSTPPSSADVEAETHRSILPVLAARSSAVDAAVDEMFGALRPSAVRGGYDPAGWASGHDAADRARLAFDLPAGETGKRQHELT